MPGPFHDGQRIDAERQGVADKGAPSAMHADALVLLIGLLLPSATTLIAYYCHGLVYPCVPAYPLQHERCIEAVYSRQDILAAVLAMPPDNGAAILVQVYV